MFIDFNNSDIPIYLQISQAIEDDIIKGILKEGTQIPSTTEISINYNVNPATIAKGFNILVSDDIIFKKRGVGMFVCEGAKGKLKEKRKNNFYKSFIIPLLDEGKKIDISVDEIIKMLERSK